MNFTTESTATSYFTTTSGYENTTTQEITLSSTSTLENEATTNAVNGSLPSENIISTTTSEETTSDSPEISTEQLFSTTLLPTSETDNQTTPTINMNSTLYPTSANDNNQTATTVISYTTDTTSVQNSTTVNEPNDTTEDGSGITYTPSGDNTTASTTPYVSTQSQTSSRLTVTSATFMMTNASTYLTDSAPTLTNTSPAPQVGTILGLEIWMFSLIIAVAAAVLLIAILGLFCWCRKRKAAELNRQARIAAMWGTGNGDDDVVMVNIAPKAGLWNSTESIDKIITTVDVAKPNAINVFEADCDDSPKSSPLVKNSSMRSILTATSNNSKTSQQKAKSKKGLTKVDLPTINATDGETERMSDGEENQSDTDSVFTAGTSTTLPDKTKLATFSKSADQKESDLEATEKKTAGSLSSAPPPPPLSQNESSNQNEGGQSLQTEETKVDSFLYGFQTTENKDVPTIPPPPPPPPTVHE